MRANEAGQRHVTNQKPRPDQMLRTECQLVPMLVVHIRHVLMRVRHALMQMRMGVRFTGRIVWCVGMRMMFVVQV